jgi:cell division control protein 7
MSALHATAAPRVDFPREANAYNQEIPEYAPEDDMDSDDPEDQLRENDFDEDEDEDEGEEEDEMDDSVKEDMMRLEDSFRGISHRYRLVNRIGEGASSALLCVWFIY